MKNLVLSIYEKKYKIKIDNNIINKELLDSFSILYYKNDYIYFKNIDNISLYQEIIDNSKFSIIFGNINTLIENSIIFKNILNNEFEIFNSLSKYFIIDIRNINGSIHVKNLFIGDNLNIKIKLPISNYKIYKIKLKDSLIDDVKYNIFNKSSIPYESISNKIFNKIDEYKKNITDIEYLDLELENLNNSIKKDELLNVINLNVELQDEYLNNNRYLINNLLDHKEDNSLLTISEEEINNPVKEIDIQSKLELLKKSVINSKIENDVDQEINKNENIDNKLERLLTNRKNYLKKYKKIKELDINKTKLYNNENLKEELKDIIKTNLQSKKNIIKDSSINTMIHNILLNEYNTIKINKKITELEIKNKNCKHIYKLLNKLKKEREESYELIIKNNIEDLYNYDNKLSKYNEKFIEKKNNIIKIANKYINKIKDNTILIKNEYQKEILSSNNQINNIVDNEDFNINTLQNKQKELSVKYSNEYKKNLNKINYNESFIKNALNILEKNYKRIININNNKLIKKINDINLNNKRNIINRDLREKIYQPIYDIISKSLKIHNKKESKFDIFDDVKNNVIKEKTDMFKTIKDNFNILKESIKERKEEYSRIKNKKKELFNKKLEYKIKKYINRHKFTNTKKNSNIYYKKKTYKSVVLW